MIPTVLVYGWYNQGNLGDDLFVDAFQYLFPTLKFVFVNRIDDIDLEGKDAVFIGGGSLIGEPLNISSTALEKIKNYKIFYLGIGGETNINPIHLELIKLAKLIATRTSNNISKLQSLNPNVMVIPDLVYSLPVVRSAIRDPKTICILPNILVIPKWTDPHWKHTAWEHFKDEFAQALDQLVNTYTIKFLPLCINDQLNDQHAAIEIINRMSNRNNKYLLDKPDNVGAAIQTLSQAKIVLTQRYHGIVLSEMAGTPYVAIHHHDKLNNSKGESLSYYGSHKNLILEKVNKALKQKEGVVLPIDRNVIRDMVETVLSKII